MKNPNSRQASSGFEHQINSTPLKALIKAKLSGGLHDITLQLALEKVTPWI